MSKRGSKSTKFIGGKDWKNGRASNDLNKKLTTLRKINRGKLLLEKFNEAIDAFGLTPKSIIVSEVKNQILTMENKDKQVLFFKNIKLFKDFSSRNNLEFTIDNYLNNKFYLKDYSGILDKEFGFSNLSREELMEMQFNHQKIKIKTYSSLKRYVIRAHIDFLLFHHK